MIPRMGIGFVGGSSQRLETNYTPTIPANGAYTFATWFKIPSGGTGILIGMGKLIPVADWNRVQINCQAPDKLRLYTKDDALTVVSQTSTKTVLDNLWHHIACIVNPADDEIILIIDGLQDSRNTGVQGIFSFDSHEVGIGCLSNEAGYSNYITGQLCEPAIYSRKLSIPEVRLLIAGKPPLAGLELYYPLKVDSRFGADNLVNAAKPGTYNGTLQNTPRIVPCPGIVMPW